MNIFNINKSRKEDKLTCEEKKLLNAEISKINLIRIKYFSLILITLGISLLILVDFPRYKTGRFKNNPGFLHLTLTHFAYFISSLIFYVLIIIKSNIKKKIFTDNSITLSVSIIILLISLYGTFAGLLIIGSISIFLMGAFGPSVIVNLKPKTSLLIYTSYYLLFIVLVSILNFPGKQLLRYYFNGAVIVFVCFAFSRSLYNIRYRELSRAIIIKNQTKELEKKNKELAELSIMKDNFVAMVNHDLKNVIGSLFSSTSYLLKRKLPDELNEYIRLLNKTTKTLLKISEDFLQVSLFQSRRIMLNYSEVNIQNLVERLITTYISETKEKNIDIKFICNVKQKVKIDSEKIFKVLSNLILIVIEASKNNSKINISIDKNNNLLKFNMIVDEKLFSKNELEIFFEPYENYDFNKSRKIHNPDLTLKICKDIIILHKGEIGVDITPENFTNFYFSIQTLNSESNIQQSLSH